MRDRRTVSFVTIFNSYGDLETIQQTLPRIIKETARTPHAKLIVNDSSGLAHLDTWRFLVEIRTSADFVLILSDRLSLGHSRNMCLNLAVDLFAPEYIAMIEDDHAYKEGSIAALIDAMRINYGRRASNGLKYGLFSICPFCHHLQNSLINTPDGHAHPPATLTPILVGGTNACFRCAPTSHWIGVLKGYDTDEYPISPFQTAGLALRNYYKGYTSLYVGKGQYCIRVEREGRGFTTEESRRPFDERYTASDPRSRFAGKDDN